MALTSRLAEDLAQSLRRAQEDSDRMRERFEKEIERHERQLARQIEYDRQLANERTQRTLLEQKLEFILAKNSKAPNDRSVRDQDVNMPAPEHVVEEQSGPGNSPPPEPVAVVHQASSVSTHQPTQSHERGTANAISVLERPLPVPVAVDTSNRCSESEIVSIGLHTDRPALSATTPGVATSQVNSPHVPLLFTGIGLQSTTTATTTTTTTTTANTTFATVQTVASASKWCYRFIGL